MKILFLDIDGVLNNATTKERFQSFTGIDVSLAHKLHRWLQKNQDIRVVLSSTWRTEEAFKDEVRRNSIPYIDCTEVMYLMRGMEIAEWLGRHPEVTEYVILDDYGPQYFLPDQKEYLVQTDPKIGLTNENLKQIEALYDRNQGTKPEGLG